MDFGLKGKKAVVLAAGKGLGFAAAEVLAKEGCKIALCSRDAVSIKTASKKIQEINGSLPIARQADVQKASSLSSFFEMVHDQWNNVDILVTNAGGPPVKSFEETTDEEWLFWYETTFMSVVRSIQAVLPQMKLKKWGRIINIASITVKSPLENLTYSNALRMAVVGLAKSLANELGPFGVTVNTVAPGYHMTDGLERIINKKVASGFNRETVIQSWKEKIPVRRLGQPQDLAGMICFLASEQAGFISGSTIQVDGGMYQGIY